MRLELTTMNPDSALSPEVKCWSAGASLRLRQIAEYEFRTARSNAKSSARIFTGSGVMGGGALEAAQARLPEQFRTGFSWRRRILLPSAPTPSALLCLAVDSADRR